MRLLRTLDVAAPAAVLWAFHERPDALHVLQPPWQRVEVRIPPRSLEVGTRVEVRLWVGPLPVTVIAEHVAYEKGRRFADRMVRGPFRSWLHEHRVETVAAGASRLTDDVAYELPGGALGRLVAAGAVARQLDRLFAHRHAVTRAWCESLFHVTTAVEWEAAKAAGLYRAPSLEAEGFIHLSSRTQIAPVARALFGDRSGLVVLRIDAARLDVPVRWEDPADEAPAPGPFPHAYGAIPTAAVVEVTERI